MYHTIKIRLKLTKEAKEHLIQYEAIYQNQIQKLISQFRQHPWNLQYTKLYFSFDTAEESNWLIYQKALHIYKAEIEKKEVTSNCSSSWSPASFRLGEESVQVHYGKQFIVKKERLFFSPTKQPCINIQEGKLLRMDLFHDEKFWFANFILFINDEKQ